MRSCYGQILGPRGHLPKFAYILWRRLDAWVHLDPHLIRQATESYMERRDAFGLVPHECSLLLQDYQPNVEKQPTTSSLCRRAHARLTMGSSQFLTKKEQRVLCTRRSTDCLCSANQSQSRPRQPYE